MRTRLFLTAVLAVLLAHCDGARPGAADLQRRGRPHPPGALPDVSSPRRARAVLAAHVPRRFERRTTSATPINGRVDAAVEAGPRLRRFPRFAPAVRTSELDHPGAVDRGGRARGRSREASAAARVPRRAGSSDRPTTCSRCAESYTVPARASDVYRCFVIPTSFAEDRWVTKVEYAPGDRKLVHHILAYIDTTARRRESRSRRSGARATRASAGRASLPAGGLCGLGARQRAATVQPTASACCFRRARPSCSRCTTTTAATEARTDRTRVALHFAKSPIDKRQRGIPVLNHTFTIPAGEKRLRGPRARGRCRQPRSCTPARHHAAHAPARARDEGDRDATPTATVRPLIHIDDWDFHWQSNYTFERARSLAGRDAHRHGRDLRQLRGEQRASRASPPRAVSWGEGTTDEMALVFVSITVDGERIGWQPHDGPSPSAAAPLSASRPSIRGTLIRRGPRRRGRGAAGPSAAPR